MTAMALQQRRFSLGLAPLLLLACGGTPTASSNGPVAEATTSSAVQVWIIYDPNAQQGDLAGEMDCLINSTNFNDIINSFNSSPYGGLRVKWAPNGTWSGHSGTMVSSYAGQCGQLYGPNAQCLTNLVINNPNLGVPGNGDIFLYVVHDSQTQCGGGNNAGVTGGAGEAVKGPNGTIHVYTGTIADGWGYNACQQRVAMHELFESATQVDSADCCTGQYPGNYGPDCSYNCASNQNVGPAGYGSYTLSCPSGRSYAGQMVEKWSSSAYAPGRCASGYSSCYQTAGCTAAH
jgi:hypothetical protein